MKKDIKVISYDLVSSLNNESKEVIVTYTFDDYTYHYSIFIELKKNFTQKDYLDEAKRIFDSDIKSGKVLKFTKSVKVKGSKKPLYIALTATLGAVAVTMSGLFIWKMIGEPGWKPMVGDINKPLTFICNEDNSSIYFTYRADQEDNTDVKHREIKLYYQVDNGNWNKVEGIHQIQPDVGEYNYTIPIIKNVKKGQEIHLACDGGGYWSRYFMDEPDDVDAKEVLSFCARGNFAVTNNIMSLKSRNNFANLNSVGDTEFFHLFADSYGIVDASGLLLPANVLSLRCYLDMFAGNINLEHAPTKLPANSLVADCYSGMFSGCSSLITAPKLSANTLADNCYSHMFSGCSSLTVAPELSANSLATGCYSGMFSNCSSLITAPKLPANMLAEACYSDMFRGCSSLVTAPELSANSLATGCYSEMFYGCSSLVTAPKLPANTLADHCYSNMFYGCSSLVTAPELSADTLSDHCYSNMFYGCSSLVTAPELPANTLAHSCYLRMFSDCSSLITAPKLPANMLAEACYSGMFCNCSNLKRIEVGFGTTNSWDWPNIVNATDGWLANAGGAIEGEKVFIWNGNEGEPEDDQPGWRSVTTVPEGWTIKHAEA